MTSCPILCNNFISQGFSSSSSTNISDLQPCGPTTLAISILLSDYIEQVCYLRNGFCSQASHCCHSDATSVSCVLKRDAVTTDIQVYDTIYSIFSVLAPRYRTSVREYERHVRSIVSLATWHGRWLSMAKMGHWGWAARRNKRHPVCLSARLLSDHFAASAVFHLYSTAGPPLPPIPLLGNSEMCFCPAASLEELMREAT